jgi:glycosyltransferase involved in cell wall biosynthesis
MNAEPLRILSNFPGMDSLPGQGVEFVHRRIQGNPGALSAWAIFRECSRHDVFLLDDNPPFLAPLCVLRWLWPFQRCRLVSADIMFVRPATWLDRIKAWSWKVLLRRVDHFVHFFKDLDGYRRYFGIGPDRSTFVPFKVNCWEKIPPAEDLSSDGEYVLIGGRSLRDLDTFAAAMRQVPYPGVLLYHDPRLMRDNGTALPLGLPDNVRAVEDDGSIGSWLDHLRRAKLVVLALLPDSIRAIGVSACLNAMALKKCVVISDGPTTRGVISDEALVVPPGDPAALAGAIRRAWEDGALREKTAAAGRKYAELAGGEERLLQDLVRICAVVAGKPTPAAIPS